MSYDLGDAVALRKEVYIAGVLADATVVLSVTDPAGTVTTPSVTHASTGVYTASVTTTAVGLWFYKWTVSGTAVEVESGQFTVYDPAPPAYSSLAGFKLYAAGTAAGSTTALAMGNELDDLLTEHLLTASRDVEDFCDRVQFYADKVASARTFDIAGRVSRDKTGYERLMIDDVSTSSGLIVEVGNDGSTWTALTDYVTYTPRARWPITALERLGGWRMYRKARITAKWGWPEIPSGVVTATNLRTLRLAGRRGSPEGVAGFADLGVVRISRSDPDFLSMLGKYMADGAGLG